MLRARRELSPLDDVTFLPQLEVLERRMAMTASLSACDNLPPLMSHGGGCACPICTGQGLQNLVPANISLAGTTGSGGLSSSSPLSSLPQLSSNSGARVKLFLDFNGNFESAWGSYRNVTTRVFDQDGDATTFSANEISTIREIWARVSEDYAPFNIDVTTIDPGNFANGAAVRLAIGGNYSDWFGQAAGGVAYVGGFTNSASNTGYVFSDALGHGTARYVAEATSHEAGHLFGAPIRPFIGLHHAELVARKPVAQTRQRPVFIEPPKRIPVPGVGVREARGADAARVELVDELRRPRIHAEQPGVEHADDRVDVDPAADDTRRFAEIGGFVDLARFVTEHQVVMPRPRSHCSIGACVVWLLVNKVS